MTVRKRKPKLAYNPRVFGGIKACAMADACPAALAWMLANRGKSMEKLYNMCPRVDWLMWFVGRMTWLSRLYTPELEARSPKAFRTALPWRVVKPSYLHRAKMFEWEWQTSYNVRALCHERLNSAVIYANASEKRSQHNTQAEHHRVRCGLGSKKEREGEKYEYR